MADAKSTVLVIDDDPDVRASVGRLLRSLGIDVQLFASIPDFLKSNAPNGPACLVEQGDAENERPFASRTRTNGRQAQTRSGGAATLLIRRP